MADQSDTDYASPACLMHEVDPAYSGLDAEGVGEWAGVRIWRKARRRVLIGWRQELESRWRNTWSERIARRLSDHLTLGPLDIVSLYWPLKGEPDLTPWMRAMSAKGVRMALPVVVTRGAPLEFREWRPGQPMERGIWDIPVPARGPAVCPTVTVAPLVGFDGAGFRLGHGGGYYDRTLAALSPRPRMVGVGYEATRLASIYPQPHDIPMDAILTEDRARLRPS